MKTDATTIKYRLQWIYWDNEDKLRSFREKGKDVSEQDLKQGYLCEAMSLLTFYETNYNSMFKEVSRVRIENAQLKERIKELEIELKIEKL